MTSQASEGAEAIIAALGLEPLGFEGGFYRETWRSALSVPKSALTEAHSGERQLGTAIYYLLGPDSRSLFHRLATDETYHFYLGDPVELTMLHPDGGAETVRLGPDVLARERVQLTVPAGSWQGSCLASGGAFALMGTTMCPGFELADFELGRRSVLLAAYDHLEARDRIELLTPSVLEAGPYELVAASVDLLHAQRRSIEALAAGLAVSGMAEGGDLLEGEIDGLLAAHAEGEARDWRRWYVAHRPAGELDRVLGVIDLQGPPDADGEVRLEVGPGLDGGEGRDVVLRVLLEKIFRTPTARRVRGKGGPGLLKQSGFRKRGDHWFRARPGVESPLGRH